METKKFKCKDEVIYRSSDNNEWIFGLFSHYGKNKDGIEYAVINSGFYRLDEIKILPYEGNEHLVGTTDEPDVEIFINYRSELMAMTKNKNWIYATLVSTHCRDNYFTVTLSNGEDIRVTEICPFSDFNPRNMEETKKHILVVRNGKIVRYKG